MNPKIVKILKKVPIARAAYRLARRLFLDTWHSRRVFGYDRSRFLKFSCRKRDSREAELAGIIMLYHVIEKGLTMPDFACGHARERVISLAGKLNEFADKFGTEEPQFRAAVAVLAEFKKIHDDAHFVLDEECSRALEGILTRVPVGPSHQTEMTRERYWSQLDSPFEQFAASRHSVRNFAGTVSVEQIRAAVALANNAPSSCNRQFVRVHCVADRELVQKCLALQNGNRGFGHLADKVLVVTADLRAVSLLERNDLFVNGGIYLMNLCYALHKNRVAHCLLNWSVKPETDLKLRKLLSLPDAETVITLLACGDVPAEFKLAGSPRKCVTETLILHGVSEKKTGGGKPLICAFNQNSLAFPQWRSRGAVGSVCSRRAA